MDSLDVVTLNPISDLALHCGRCKDKASAVVLAAHEGLCRRCHERDVPRCAACHHEARQAVLYRFGGVCRGCHFRARFPQLGRVLEGVA